MAQTAENLSDTINAAILKATVDPDWFCETLLNCPNDPWQSELMNAIADIDRKRLGYKTLFNHLGLNRFSVVAFHGPGKTHIIAKIGWWWGFTRKGRVPCTGPKLEQLKSRLWPELRKLKASANRALAEMVTINKTTLEWCKDVDWCMLAESASQPENLAGFHDKWLAFLVEEASGVEEQMFPVIEGALTTEGSILVLIGNPTRTTGEFWASHCKQGTRELYYRLAITPDDSPRIDQQWVKDMIAKYGANSPVVKVRVLGKFVDAEENQLLMLPWLEDAKDKEFEDDGTVFRKRISVDVADGGIDDSVITVAYLFNSFTRLVKQYTYSFSNDTAVIDTADAAENVWNAFDCNINNGDDIVVDGLGVGAGTAAELYKRKLPVIKYKGGSDSDDKKQWRNRRVQSYLSMRDDFRDGTVDIASDFVTEDEWLHYTAQMCCIRTRDAKDRLEDLETKLVLKKLFPNIGSPDKADSTAMIWATQTPKSFEETTIATFGELESESNVDY